MELTIIIGDSDPVSQLQTLKSSLLIADRITVDQMSTAFSGSGHPSSGLTGEQALWLAVGVANPEPWTRPGSDGEGIGAPEATLPISSTRLFGQEMSDRYFGSVSDSDLHDLATETIRGIWDREGWPQWALPGDGWDEREEALHMTATDALQSLVVGMRRIEDPDVVLDRGANRTWTLDHHQRAVYAVLEGHGLVHPPNPNSAVDNPGAQSLGVAYHFLQGLLPSVHQVPIERVVAWRNHTQSERRALLTVALEAVSDVLNEDVERQEEIIESASSEVQRRYDAYVTALRETDLRTIMNDMRPELASTALVTPVLMIGSQSHFGAVVIATGAAMGLAIRAAFTQAIGRRAVDADTQHAFHWVYRMNRQTVDAE